jgi:hypothetical protein
MAQVSARNNILPALKTLGIIREDGTPTPLATKWRDDAQYSTVCKEIAKNVYPQNLFDIAPDPLNEKDTVRRWFASHGVGESAVGKISALFFLLMEADPSKGNEVIAKGNGTPKPKVTRLARPERAPVADTPTGVATPSTLPAAPPKPAPVAPQLHVNIQIHISPEVTPDQIEAIFASMGKHLKSMSE